MKIVVSPNTKKISPNTVVKLLTNNCVCNYPIDVPQLMGLGIFDKIVITQRRNLIDTCLSLYYADYIVKKFQWTEDEQVLRQQFNCDEQFAVNFCKEISFFKKTVEWFDKTKVHYDIFDYDKFLDGQDQRIFGSLINKQMPFKFKKSNIDYQSLCQNYERIKELINQSV